MVENLKQTFNFCRNFVIIILQIFRKLGYFIIRPYPHIIIKNIKNLRVLKKLHFVRSYNIRICSNFSVKIVINRNMLTSYVIKKFFFSINFFLTIEDFIYKCYTLIEVNIEDQSIFKSKEIQSVGLT